MDYTLPTQNIQSKKTKSLAYTEEKELRRVFERLCDYQIKRRITDEITDLQAWRHNAKVKVKESLASNILVDNSQVETTHSATQVRIDELKQKLNEIESNPNKAISVGDIHETLKFLGVNASKKEVEEMMWEVDEDLNGKCDWEEFKLMYRRNINDKSFLEPSRMVRYSCIIFYSYHSIFIYLS